MLAELRVRYHRQVFSSIVHIRGEIPNFADTSSQTSVHIAQALLDALPYPTTPKPLPGQRAGRLFEELTAQFLEQCFRFLSHIRPGKWLFTTQGFDLADFEQYHHLAEINRILKENSQLAAILGASYLVTPDILVARYPLTDEEINQVQVIVEDEAPVPVHTPLRARNRPQGTLLLHASISCKWTIRSDRAQNIRTEALNLVRLRKGRAPHIVAVTAEPLPTRLASLALGTGDLDCVYHFALPELRQAVHRVGSPEQQEMLEAMIEGRRLRDIADLPFDLAI